jgi:hypothetical protein
MTTLPEWRKSSRSTQGESDCVEVTVWRKSSRSAQGESNCVEVAPCSSELLTDSAIDSLAQAIAVTPNRRRRRARG